MSENDLKLQLLIIGTDGTGNDVSPENAISNEMKNVCNDAPTIFSQSTVICVFDKCRSHDSDHNMKSIFFIIADDVGFCASPNVHDCDDQDDYHEDGGAHLFLLISSISLFLLCLCLCTCLCLFIFVCVSDGDDQDDYHNCEFHLFFLVVDFLNLFVSTVSSCLSIHLCLSMYMCLSVSLYLSVSLCLSVSLRLYVSLCLCL